MAYCEMVGIPKPVDPYEWKGKARLVKFGQDVFTIIDAAGLGIFFAVRNLLRPELEIFSDRILEYLNAAAGVKYSMEELLKSGERIFLVKAGFQKQGNSLPARLTKEPLLQGPAGSNIVHLDEILGEYYKERGWDKEGIPAQAKLKELGLD